MLRKKIHKIIDQCTDEQLPELLDILNDYITYDTYVPRKDGLPVYEMGNPKHTKIIIDRYLRPNLKIVKNESEV